MNLAKLSVSGQIVLPIEIRKYLDIDPGDKVLFIRKANGEVLVRNASSINLDADYVEG